MSLWPPWVCKTDTRNLAKAVSKEYLSQNSNYSINAHFSTVFTNFLLNNISQISLACYNAPPLQMQWHQNNQSLQMNFSGQALLRSTVKCPTWTHTAVTELRTCYQPEHQVSQLSCENEKGISLHGKRASQKKMGILESKERPKRQWDCHGRSRIKLLLHQLVLDGVKAEEERTGAACF